MAFKKNDIDKLLAACHRRCCICHKICGVKMEVHHADFKSKGGSDNIENAIPLCFECHAEVVLYNPEHPKGKKYSSEELLIHKKQWLNICKESPQALINTSTDREIGPLEGMVLELEFNLNVAKKVNLPGKVGCALNTNQYNKAVSEGALLILPQEIRDKLNEAYYAIGVVNTALSKYISTQASGPTKIMELAAVVQESESVIKEAHNSLKKFLS